MPTRKLTDYSKIFFWTGFTMIPLGVSYMVGIFHVVWALVFPTIKYNEAILQFKTMSVSPGYAMVIIGVIVCAMASGKAAELMKSVRGK